MIEILTSWGFITGLILMAIATFIVDSAYRSEIKIKNDRLELAKMESDNLRYLLNIAESKRECAMSKTKLLEKEIEEAGMVLCEGEKRSFLRKKRVGKDLTKKKRGRPVGSKNKINKK